MKKHIQKIKPVQTAGPGTNGGGNCTPSGEHN